MLIIFKLGTSMKSHSAAPMVAAAAAAAAGWRLQGYRVRRPLMTIIALIHGSVQFRRQSIDQIRSEFFQSKLFQYYYIILNNLSSVIGVIQFLLKSLNDKSRCTINKYVTGYVTSNQIKMFQFCLIDIMSSTL